MSEAKPSCPSCHSQSVVKNGRTRHGRQIRPRPPRRGLNKCREWGRQFVEHPKWTRVAELRQSTQEIVSRMLLEKVLLAGIPRVAEVSELWLQNYVNDKYATMSQQLEVQPKHSGSLKVQRDELWSFVDEKGNKQWVWLAWDVDTREIMGCYIGDRSATSAQKLWESLPALYCQCEVCYTDFWSASAEVGHCLPTSSRWERNRQNQLD